MGDNPPFKKQEWTADDPPADAHERGRVEADDVIVDAWLNQYAPKTRRLNKSEKEAATAAEAAANELHAEWLREQGKRGGKASGDKRREESNPSPIVEFITNKLTRTPDISGRDMVTALKNEAKNARVSGGFVMSADGTAFVVVMDNGEEKHRLAITSVPMTVSRHRKIKSKHEPVQI
jgi:hypothetical protein